MRTSLPVLLGVGALVAAAVPAAAQPLPPGPYEAQCREIRLQGLFLTARCPGPTGWGVSSINVNSCSTPIVVDREGALACTGPGGGQPPAGPPPRPGPAPRPPGGYPPGGPGQTRWSITIYEQPGFRGRAVRLDGDTPNLSYSGLNDRVGSIRLGARGARWLACSDAGYRGRCATVSADVADTRRMGMGRSISSLRPLR